MLENFNLILLLAGKQLTFENATNLDLKFFFKIVKPQRL